MGKQEPYVVELSVFSLNLDIGNSTVDWLLTAPDGAEKHGKALDFANLVEQVPSETINQVNMACVRQSRLKEWQRAIADKWGLTARVAQVQADYKGLKLAYKQPRQLGVDRWLALLAVHSRSEPSWLVIDAGSALTVDFLNEGRHLGGFIAPGIESMQQVCYEKVDSPPQRDGIVAALGLDTASCIRLGIWEMTRIFVEQQLKRFSAEYPLGQAIFTGGDGEALYRECSAGVDEELRKRLSYDPCLVCRGLMLLKPVPL